MNFGSIKQAISVFAGLEKANTMCRILLRIYFPSSSCIHIILIVITDKSIKIYRNIIKNIHGNKSMEQRPLLNGRIIENKKEKWKKRKQL